MNKKLISRYLKKGGKIILAGMKCKNKFVLLNFNSYKLFSALVQNFQPYLSKIFHSTIISPELHFNI